ncbi:MAG TPA: hypothetical protein DEQ14_05215 [Treponema sp.]|nr:hypothetical protein [Treponema sp.]
MSYSRTYRSSVSYSGSVSYSYPASQSGGRGSAHYSGTIPVNITVNVRTEPFDGSLSRFNNSIDTLGASVVAMRAAQCAAIQKTAEEVSASLINGFFGTVNTELSQQLQALDSAMKAEFGLLQQQSKTVEDKKNVMEGDYNRISSRYAKLFADLDNECYKRIYALDKQSFNLSEKVQKQLLSESVSDTASANLLGIEELSSSKTMFFVSAINRKVMEVLRTLHNYISQELVIHSLINSFLLNEQIDEKLVLGIPVIWSENDSLETGTTSKECFIPAGISEERKRAITDAVDRFCANAEWKTIEQEEKELLNREFNAMAEADFLNAEDENGQRIYQTMLSLWHNSDSLCMEERRKQ